MASDSSSPDPAGDSRKARRKGSKNGRRPAHPDAERTRLGAARRDRFGWVLTASIVFHLVIVLGVSFVLPSEAGDTRFSPPLKIVLVDIAAEESNPDSDTLAQANSQGEDQPSALPSIQGGEAAPSSAEVEEKERMLMAEQADALFNPELFDPSESTNTDGQTRDELTNSINLAFLNSQAKPRERFVSADAKASEVAPYLENWRMLVERVGNINYPDAAKELQLEGDLVMDVTIRSDGSVQDVRILRSSGEKVLDDGAERIVQIAAPFEPFTEVMKKDYDVLHIIRTWRFSQNRVEDISQ